MTTYRVIKIRSVLGLQRALDQYAVPEAGWAKTKSQLLKQIRDGETILAVRKGKLYRFTWRAQANIFRTTPRGRRERLREIERIVNGEEMKLSVGVSVSEKLIIFPQPRPEGFKPEGHQAGIIRCFLEELGTRVRKRLLTFVRVQVERVRKPGSFPIPTINFIYLYQYEMPYADSRPRYVENRSRKKTTWGWKRSRQK